jgi:hypothetical protein
MTYRITSLSSGFGIPYGRLEESDSDSDSDLPVLVEDRLVGPETLHAIAMSMGARAAMAYRFLADRIEPSETFPVWEAKDLSAVASDYKVKRFCGFEIVMNEDVGLHLAESNVTVEIRENLGNVPDRVAIQVHLPSPSVRRYAINMLNEVMLIRDDDFKSDFVVGVLPKYKVGFLTGDCFNITVRATLTTGYSEMLKIAISHFFALLMDGVISEDRTYALTEKNSEVCDKEFYGLYAPCATDGIVYGLDGSRSVFTSYGTVRVVQNYEPEDESGRVITPRDVRQFAAKHMIDLGFKKLGEGKLFSNCPFIFGADEDLCLPNRVIDTKLASVVLYGVDGYVCAV